MSPKPTSPGEGSLTVAKAARTVGLSPSALRYYEREGILAPSSKSGAGYRLYDRAALDRLRFVRAAQSIGLPLKDIRVVLEMDARTSRDTMRGLLESRLALVDEKLEELKTVRDALSRALARCRRSGECCEVLVSLSVGASTESGDPHEDMRVQDRRRRRTDRGRPDGVRLDGKSRRNGRR